MPKFKPLEWSIYEEINGVYAEPYGLGWHYSIIEHAKDKVEFALLDSYSEYAPGFPKMCKFVAQAQEMAHEHYRTLLEYHIA